jgi:hypothetical protein
MERVVYEWLDEYGVGVWYGQETTTTATTATLTTESGWVYDESPETPQPES